MSTPVLSSMRVTLTLWYTAILALVLIIFSLTTYFYIARSTRRHTDDSLADTANGFISNFNLEMGDENQPPLNAAREAAAGFHFSDRQAMVFDQQNQMIVASAPPAELPQETRSFESLARRPEFPRLLSAANATGRSFDTLSESGSTIRTVTAVLPAGEERYYLVVAHPLDQELKTIGQARRAFLLAIPIALLLAGFGGYLLARKSLQPVVVMGEQAAKIGASNLNERIPVPASKELGRLAIIFNDLLGRLDRSFTQQKRFMADASHELRTPVAVICGESEVTLSQPTRTEADYRDSLEIVHEEGRRLTHMVEDLFTMARAEAGEYRLVLSDYYLDESLQECVRAVRSLAMQKQIELDYKSNLSEIAFRGDEPLIKRMVLNVLHNAIKYTGPKGRVGIELVKNESHYQIFISDTGVGIPVEAQPHIFERFFRVDKARSRGEFLNGSGAGLGLSIARWAAELHGGEIHLEGSDEKGSTFTISLPNAEGVR
jgi:two-component system, OmpR family, sensor kinase